MNQAPPDPPLQNPCHQYRAEEVPSLVGCKGWEAWAACEWEAAPAERVKPREMKQSENTAVGGIDGPNDRESRSVHKGLGGDAAGGALEMMKRHDGDPNRWH